MTVEPFNCMVTVPYGFVEEVVGFTFRNTQINCCWSVFNCEPRAKLVCNAILGGGGVPMMPYNKMFPRSVSSPNPVSRLLCNVKPRPTMDLAVSVSDNMFSPNLVSM